jgi:general secretion pathway protein C
MGIDALAKRYSPLVVCLMLGIAAYFQASGLGKLIGAVLAPASAMPLSRGVAAFVMPSSDTERDTFATAIIERNPFDSVTGPLTPRGDAALPKPGESTPGADPYRDPPCEVAKVVLIASSPDPTWSFAAITGPDGKTGLRRAGDDFYGGKVTFVGDQRPTPHPEGEERGLWDRVWLTSPNGMRCQLALGARPPGKMPATGPTPPPAPGGLPPDLAGKIRQRGEHEFEVDRSAVDALIANPAELMKTRVVPDKVGDQVVGLKLYGIKPNSLLGMLGIENGDRLSSINGFEMNDPQKMLEAYSKLLRADHLTASVVRNGKPMNLEFSIK